MAVRSGILQNINSSRKQKSFLFRKEIDRNVVFQGFHDPGFVDQCDQIPPLCELISEEQMAAALGNDFCDSLSPESRASYSTLAPEERPAKLLKTGCWSSSDAARRRVLSFAGVGGGGGAAAVTVKPEEEVVGFSVSVGSDSSYETVKGKRSNSGRRPPTRSKDHTIAERRRREKLSQRFIALSAMVPGLKKVLTSSHPLLRQMPMKD